jgi:iron complex outermembrane receptor protein
MGVYKALLLAGCAGTVTLAAPAMAQNNNNVDCRATPNNPACTTASTTPSSTAPSSEGTIVVTGSRIARPEYDSNSPTVSVDEQFFDQSTTAAIEQSLNKLPQFVVSQSSTTKNNDATGLLPAGGDIQPNATNTPGAATISLRGVGANRSLVLIDGRRGTPTNASGVVDVSTIPNSALQRVEIVSGGASATYGADAVAGVTNFILKDDVQGLELDGQIGLSDDGNGFEYQIGGIVGTDFPDGRGNVSLAMSLNTRERMLQRDNPYY